MKEQKELKIIPVVKHLQEECEYIRGLLTKLRNIDREMLLKDYHRASDIFGFNGPETGSKHVKLGELEHKLIILQKMEKAGIDIDTPYPLFDGLTIEFKEEGYAGVGAHLYYDAPESVQNAFNGWDEVNEWALNTFCGLYDLYSLNANKMPLKALFERGDEILDPQREFEFIKHLYSLTLNVDYKVLSRVGNSFREIVDNLRGC